MIARRNRVRVQFFPEKSRLISNDPFFSVRSAPNNLSFNRLGAVIGKRVFGSAVKRNGLKRKIFTVFALKPDFFKEGREGRDFVFFAKPGVRNLTGEKLLEQINQYVQLI